MSLLSWTIAVALVIAIRHYLLKYIKSQMPTFPKSCPDAEPVFPPSFHFGASTAAFQIEEDMPPSNWSIWETKIDEHGRPRVPHDTKKVEGLKNFNTDASLVKELGCDMYRFSVSWSRIEPRPGYFDKEAMMAYRNQCIHLRTLSIEPLVTLWHFEHPAWLDEQGGVLAPEYLSRFSEFVEFVITALSDVCSYYHTINEPVGYVVSSYVGGLHPPGKGSITNAVDAMASLFRCHVAAYRIIKRLCPSAKVSFAKNEVPFLPRHSWSLIEAVLAHILNFYTSVGLKTIETGEFRCLWMKRVINGMKGTQDFISINHYYCAYVTLNWKEWPIVNGNRIFLLSYGESFLPVSDFGWGLNSGSLAGVVRWINRLYNPRKIPIMVTEHGIADKNDEMRQWFLKESLQHLASAVNEGVPVIGYIHWSLMDNFEWTEGFKMKFGLYEVDMKSFERKKKKSAEIYSKIIKSKAILGK